MSLGTVLTPILPHTMDEVYSYLPHHKLESIYLEDMVKPVYYDDANQLIDKYTKFMAIRNDVLKALEEARNNKVIGKSLNASLYICPNTESLKVINSLNANLKQLFIVSKLNIVSELEEGTVFDSGKILVKACLGLTCARCWQVVDAVDEDGLCPRCAEIVRKLRK